MKQDLIVEGQLPCQVIIHILHLCGILPSDHKRLVPGCLYANRGHNSLSEACGVDFLASVHFCSSNRNHEKKILWTFAFD